MEELTSFRSFKLLSMPQFVEYGIYLILAILIVIILKNTKKTDKPKGCILSVYKALAMGLLGNMLLGVIYSCSFALYFIIFSPKYEAKVISSVKRMENIRSGKSISSNVGVHYSIFELKDNKGKIIQGESNEGILGEPIIGEKATIAYKNGELITVTIFSVFIYVMVLLISLFAMSVLSYWTLLVF